MDKITIKLKLTGQSCLIFKFFVKSPKRKTKFTYFFEVIGLIRVEILNPFSLFALYASDNLVHILLQLGTFHAYYTIHKN